MFAHTRCCCSCEVVRLGHSTLDLAGKKTSGNWSHYDELKCTTHGCRAVCGTVQLVRATCARDAIYRSAHVTPRVGGSATGAQHVAAFGVCAQDSSRAAGGEAATVARGEDGAAAAAANERVRDRGAGEPGHRARPRPRPRPLHSSRHMGIFFVSTTVRRRGCSRRGGHRGFALLRPGLCLYSGIPSAFWAWMAPSGYAHDLARRNYPLRGRGLGLASRAAVPVRTGRVLRGAEILQPGHPASTHTQRYPYTRRPYTRRRVASSMARAGAPARPLALQL